jgi:hypothetical protein
LRQFIESLRITISKARLCSLQQCSACFSTSFSLTFYIRDQDMIMIMTMDTAILMREENTIMEQVVIRMVMKQKLIRMVMVTDTVTEKRKLETRKQMNQKLGSNKKRVKI